MERERQCRQALSDILTALHMPYLISLPEAIDFGLGSFSDARFFACMSRLRISPEPSLLCGSDECSQDSFFFCLCPRVRPSRGCEARQGASGKAGGVSPPSRLKRRCCLPRLLHGQARKEPGYTTAAFAAPIGAMRAFAQGANGGAADGTRGWTRPIPRLIQIPMDAESCLRPPYPEKDVYLYQDLTSV